MLKRGWFRVGIVCVLVAGLLQLAATVGTEDVAEASPGSSWGFRQYSTAELALMEVTGRDCCVPSVGTTGGVTYAAVAGSGQLEVIDLRAGMEGLVDAPSISATHATFEPSAVRPLLVSDAHGNVESYDLSLDNAPFVVDSTGSISGPDGNVPGTSGWLQYEPMVSFPVPSPCDADNSGSVYNGTLEGDSNGPAGLVLDRCNEDVVISQLHGGAAQLPTGQTAVGFGPADLAVGSGDESDSTGP